MRFDCAEPPCFTLTDLFRFTPEQTAEPAEQREQREKSQPATNMFTSLTTRLTLGYLCVYSWGSFFCSIRFFSFGFFSSIPARQAHLCSLTAEDEQLV